ncbi:MAG TPA: hypothetical protein VHE13_09680 [Opitutus sp.]|nr:hypothetical protein [Opitutus sp.]
METPAPVPSPLPPRRRTVWRWILGGLAACIAAVALGAYHLVTLARDAQALRNEVLASLHVNTSTRIQGSAGPLLIGTVRAGLHFVHHIPDDARDALAAIHSASVGVYRVRGAISGRSRAAMFASADAVMNRRGWIRVVGVNDRDDTVLIYTPATPDWGNTQRVCLAVCDKEEIVVVAATANTKALSRLVARHADLHDLKKLGHGGVEL